MKTWKRRQFNRVSLLRLLMLLSYIAFICQPQAVAMAHNGSQVATNNSFFIRSYNGKCLDFGAAPHVTGSPVFIYDCNGSAAQRVMVVEIDPTPISKHEVVLFVDNNKVIGARGDTGFSQLEIQEYTASVWQVFELDGDSIMLAADRRLVVEVEHSHGTNRTPVILDRRNLDDTEFWTFTSSDGSNRRPTRGFVQVTNDDELHARYDFLKAVWGARWGTVIELDSNVSIDLTTIGPLSIRAGVTIRGNRRGTLPGPLLKSLSDQTNLRNPYFPNSDVGMLIINGDHVRITGLRMQGPGGEDQPPYATGIATQDKFKAIIDHNEIFGWTAAAVNVTSDNINDLSNPFLRPTNLRVVRNFIHHNNSSGYGVVTYGGYPLIEGNTFVSNRHSIAASNEADSAYIASFNLVLSTLPQASNWPFDAHGTGSHGFGGTAGQYFQITGNTFLNTERENFTLRGTPTIPAVFRANVSMQSQDDALTNYGDAAMLVVSNNQFSAPNPTKRLGVGDFDGDGIQDLFLATGAAWYYAPGGQAEWRYLYNHTDTLSMLLLGDFDADRRTDVFTQHDYNWDVSWGGASPWENINVSGAILGDAAVGDFIGDERDDVFYSDGLTWHVSDGGVGQFTELNTSSYRVSRLRFGDFNADGKTDVFSVVDGQWKVSYSGISGWQFLRPKLTDSVAGLIVADFNGDGRADVATSTKIFWPPLSYGIYEWKVSFGGTEPWTTLGENSQSLDSVAAIGRFDNIPDIDVLVWHNNYLDQLSVNTENSLRHSREDMR